MRKRSKIQVEIRNILSEILLDSLKCGNKALVLYLIYRYCQNSKHKDLSKLDWKELTKNNDVLGRLEFDWRDVSKDRHFVNIFDIQLGSRIHLKSRYRNYISFICGRIERYWKFISRRLLSLKGLENAIEERVKIGVMLFNEGFFFECHEYLEEAWLKEKGREKAFLKGLIHASVAFYHLEYDNIKGTINYLNRSYRRLKEFEPDFLGVNVRAFLSDIDRSLKYLEDSNSGYLKDAIPKIRIID